MLGRLGLWLRVSLCRVVWRVWRGVGRWVLGRLVCLCGRRAVVRMAATGCLVVTGMRARSCRTSSTAKESHMAEFCSDCQRAREVEFVHLALDFVDVVDAAPEFTGDLEMARRLLLQQLESVAGDSSAVEFRTFASAARKALGGGRLPGWLDTYTCDKRSN